MSQPICACGKQLLNSNERCLSCYEKRLKRCSFHAYALPRHGAAELTPPPSQPTSPRPSLDGSVGTRSSSRSRPESRSRPGYALEALNTAFASEDGISNFLPAAAYSRTSSRSSRRPSSSSSSPRFGNSTDDIRRSSTSIARPVSMQQRSPRPATPEQSSSYDSGYAPMAAGFARLGLNASKSTESASRERSVSRRSGRALEVKWFDGPA